MTALELDQQVVFGILSGRASTAIARRLYREFRLNGLQITPEQWVILMALTNKDGITQKNWLSLHIRISQVLLDL